MSERLQIGRAYPASMYRYFVHADPSSRVDVAHAAALWQQRAQKAEQALELIEAWLRDEEEAGLVIPLPVKRALA